MKYFLLISVLLLQAFCTRSQDFSNRGTEFWLAYPAHIDGNSSRMALYISSTVSTSGTVFLANTSIPFTVTANQATVVQISPANYAILNSQNEGVNPGRAIRITAQSPVVVYAHILNAARSGSTLLYPANTLGRDYMVASYSSVVAQSPPQTVVNGSPAGSQFTIVAVEDNTTIEIIPTAPDVAGTRAVNVPFEISLNRGDVYQYRTSSSQDVTGSRIRSKATATASCKPIAVFSGSSWTSLGCPNIPGSSGCPASGGDNLFLQMVPKSAWGKQYVTAPFADRPFDIYRILVDDPSTIVNVNGTNLSPGLLVNGSYYEIVGSTPNVINTDKPVIVVQYMVSQNCDRRNNISPNCDVFASTAGFPGDPEMVIVNSIEQTINDVTVVSARRDLTPPNTNITKHFFTIIMKTANTGTLRIDGAPPTGSFIPIPGSGYSYLHENVTNSTASNPSHRIRADSGFVALAYGLGSVESYGYNAGSNVIDLYQYISTSNKFATVNSPVACKSSPFILSITLPYRPTTMDWEVSGFPNVSRTAPVPDSSFVLDGRTLYLFRLPDPYVYNLIGSYPIKVTVNNPTPDGCAGLQVIKYDLQVFNPPVADFSWPVTPATGCTDSIIPITTNNNSGGRPIIKHFWDFGDGTFAYTNNPQKVYTTPGQYRIRYAVLTDVGCLSDTVEKVIQVTRTPVARFGISPITCINKQVVFSDSSTLAGGYGSLTNWSWNLGNSTLLNNPNGNNVTTTYTTATSYTATLQVRSSTGCLSPVFSLPVTIHPKPVPDFSMSNACLPVGAVTFTDLSTIPSGSTNGFTYQWNFGEPSSGALNSSVLKNPVHNYASTGPFTIKMIVTSANGCVDSVSKVQNNVFPQPKAAIGAPAEVCWKVPVTFSSTASNGFTHPVNRWEWRFSDGSVSTEQNPVKTFAAPGTYTARLWVFTNQNCVSDTVTHTLVVNPWPTAANTLSSPLCEKNQVTISDNSTANAGTLVRWYWSLGDGTVLNAANGNAVQHTYAAWGNQTIRQVVENSKGCISDTLVKTVRIHPLPQVGFVLPEVCLNDAQALFTDTTRMADASGGLSYFWQFNAGTPPITPAPGLLTSTARNPSVKYNAVGNYTVTLRVTSAVGCIDSVSRQFTVNGSVPQADYAILSTNNRCSNRKVEIQNRSTVDFGWLTRVEIYWDAVGNPTQFETDEDPLPNEIYAHSYPVFQSPATRDFRVRFRAFSGGICVNDVIKTITVNASPLIQFSPMPGICLDAAPRQITEAIETAGLPGTGIYTGPGVSSAGLFNPAVAGVGIHTIRYKFISAAGCVDSTEQTIEVWPRPLAKFGVVLPSCEKNLVSFSDSSVANASSLSSWKWNVGDGSAPQLLSTPVGFGHTYATFGTYQVQLEVTNNRGCTSLPFQLPVQVHPLPRVDFRLPNVCLPAGTAAFTELSTIPDGTQNSFRYRWDFGDAAAIPANSDTSLAKNPVYVYRNLGPYAVQLKVTSSNGCVDSLTRQLTTVFPQPKARFNSIDSLCLGTPVSFTDNSSGTGSAIRSWHWYFDNGDSSRVQNPAYTFRNQGIYNVKLYVYTSEGCVSDTAIKQVAVWNYPVISAGPDLFVLEDGIKKISEATATGSGLQFLWTPALYLDNRAVLNPVITQPKDDITYRLTVTGRANCSSSDEVFVKVLRFPTPPNTFTPNGDGTNDTWVIQNLSDYPGCIVEVYNTAGTLVYRSVGYTTPWDGTWKGQQLPVGTYYYVIDPKNGRNRQAGYVTILR